ncbi:alpha-amylase family glycosyl hydrolase [Algoriphagus mannitolivorans]|uniref:alpha-amylase family glycosyl hydrolase n=1 Tax=Algoriphagus mannitolivorans TaxID=226504 RepID=UPI000429E4A5|nr:alpha-amylase family glycosyl hydrolase [Algoriphagus mannitolivorans]
MKKFRFHLFILLFLTTIFSWAQVTTEPAIPLASQQVRIIYDASKGTSGLKDCNCDVYIHIGAVTAGPASTTWSIVPFQWGTTNPAAKMTKVQGQTNLYTFDLTPNTFFPNPSGLTIYRLGLVFRNADGTKEGKTTSNSDFFVDLSQGFQVVFTQPQSNALSLQVGDTFEFKAESSELADLTLELNGNKVAEKANAKEITYSFLASSAGTFQMTAKAQKGADTNSKTVNLTVFTPSEKAPLPAGVRLGINYLSSTEAVLALQAPKKNIVHVIGDFNDWKILPEYQMKVTPDGEIFWLNIEGLLPKQEYIFQYLVDGEIRIGDPYTDKTSDPFNDQEIINQGRYPGLKPYPSGKTNFQASYLQTDQDPFLWKNLTYTRPKPEELVVYELLVRDFDDRRTYKAVLERLDYLKDLGVNAIELMPVGEFEGNLSWGYNPSFFFAPDKYYGTKNDLKTLIDEAHGKGIMVILDLVLNHAFGQNPMVRLYNDGDYGAPTLDNPWFNREAKHPFNVGYDFNHESAYTKAFVDSVNSYWLSEYKIDGIRFDLSKGFTQVNSGNNVGQWSQYDASRIKIWKHIYDRIKAKHPEAYVILEHLSENSEEKELADYGLMFWGNMNGTSRNLAKGNNDNMQGAYFKNRGWIKNHLIAYQESHDEERVMWETLNFGLTSPVNLKDLENAVNRQQIMTAFYFAIPGPKMLWQFGEFGYDLELNNDRLAVKPTRWDYLNNPERVRLFKLYQEMIKLKSNYPVFSNPANASINLTSTFKTIHLNHAEMEVFLFGNFDLESKGSLQVQFPKAGKWYNYFTGEELNLSSTQRSFGFRPNEFYLFTDKPLPKPGPGILQTDYITGIPESISLEGLKMYPIPAEGTLTIELPNEMEQINYRVIDMSGRVVLEGESQAGNQNLDLYLGEITRGIYIFEAFDTKRVLHQRFIKN